MAQFMHDTFYGIAHGLTSVWNFLISPVEPFNINLGDNWAWDSLEAIINFVGDLIVLIVNSIPVPEGYSINWLTFIIGYGAIYYVIFAIVSWFAQLFK